MNSKDLCQAFLNRENIAGVEYQHNDYVLVIDGPHQGKNGSLVSLLAIETDPTFLVELEDRATSKYDNRNSA
jgi:4-hydroxy-3-methylbut-2-enyl diphosphate reductase IspH